MTIIDKDNVLIDRYLAGSLSGVELQQFMERLWADEQFKAKVTLRNLLADSIHHAEDLRLSALIDQQIDFRSPKINPALKLIFIFLFVTFAGILLWDFIGERKKDTPRFSLNIFRRPKTEVAVQKEKVYVKVKEEQSLIDSSNINPSSVPSVSIDLADTVIVRQDELLIIQEIKATQLSENVEDYSLSSSAASKLNPAADIEETVKSSSYNVEFWVSPINYKGYKLQQDHLVLFGLEQPDAVKLFRLDDQLILKYGNELYRLNPTSDFLTFRSIKESDIPGGLK